METGLEQLKSKQETTQRSLLLRIIHTNKHISDNLDYRYSCIKWILQNFKQFVYSLQLKLCGDELFLLNPGLKFPDLEELSLSAYIKTGIGGEGRIIDYGNSTLLKQTLIERHADTIQILQIKQYANLNIKTQLKLKSLMLEDVDSYTLNNVLNNCKDTLESLEINKNNIADIYLPNLRHVRFENCNMSAAFYERYSDNLISLELDYQRINFMKENPRFFSNLKYFTSSCIDNNFPVLEYCTSSIDCLSVITIADIHIIPQCIRNLKDLYLHFINKSSIPLIIENYLSLEFLLISDSDASYLEILNKDLYFPKLKTVLLPDFQNNQVLQFFARSCPEDVQIITNDDLAEEIMVRRARSNYPYPRISRSVRFFER